MTESDQADAVVEALGGPFCRETLHAYDVTTMTDVRRRCGYKLEMTSRSFDCTLTIWDCPNCKRSIIQDDNIGTYSTLRTQLDRESVELAASPWTRMEPSQ